MAERAKLEGDDSSYEEDLMGNGHDRFEREDRGGGFIMGLLTGTVLGAGLGMLFAPKRGAELRGQLSESAGNLSRAASDQYQRVASAASSVAEKGREVYDKAREAVSRGAQEVERAGEQAQEAVERFGSRPQPGAAGTAGTSGNTKSSFSNTAPRRTS